MKSYWSNLMVASVINRLIKCESGNSSSDALTSLTHLTLPAAVLLLAVVMVAHGCRVIGVEATEQRCLVEGVHLPIEQLLHDFGQFVRVIFVVDE